MEGKTIAETEKKIVAPAQVKTSAEVNNKKQDVNKKSNSANQEVRNRSEKIGASIDSVFGSAIMSHPIAQQAKGVLQGSNMVANKFSEKYRKARAQERKERGVK
jgi:hypothetical protein